MRAGRRRGNGAGRGGAGPRGRSAWTRWPSWACMRMRMRIEYGGEMLWRVCSYLLP